MFKVIKFDSNSEADSVCNELFSRKTSILKKDKKINNGKISKKKQKKSNLQNNEKLKDEIKNILNKKCDLANLKKTKFKNNKNKRKGQEKKSLNNVEPENSPSNTIHNRDELNLFQKGKKKKRKKKLNLESKNNLVKTQKTDSLVSNKKINKSKQKLKEIQSSSPKQDSPEPNKNKKIEKPNIILADSEVNREEIKHKKKAKVQNALNISCTQVSRKGKRRELTLREKMMARLQASRFRYLNEQLYSSDSKEAQKFFTQDPDAFKAYHEGYRQQINKWPLNPVDVIIRNIQKLPKNYTIADFGCGDAKIAKTVSNKVHSFDLVASNDLVTPCDMAHVPLENSSIDVAVFCLSLMGTNLHDYLLEANRVLKVGGVLKIAEVESRFDDVKEFIEALKRFNFKNVWKDLSHNLFYFLDFKKEQNINNKKKLPTVSLHPCLYKKR